MSRAERTLLRGGKFSSRHSTVIEHARPLLVALKARPEVSKIVLGQIVPTGKGTLRVKATPIPAGLRLQVQGATSNQTFYVYTSDPAATERYALNAWEAMWR